MLNGLTLSGWRTQGFVALFIVVISVVADQVTKNVAEQLLVLHQPIAVIPFFNFTLAYNEGAAFSFLSEAGGWQRWFFVVLSAVISIVLIFWIGQLKKYEKLTRISLALVLGGAIGNLIDRALYGKVVDFLDVYYQAWHWPTFNIADCCISVGAVGLLLLSFREGEPKDGFIE